MASDNVIYINIYKCIPLPLRSHRVPTARSWRIKYPHKWRVLMINPKIVDKVDNKPLIWYVMQLYITLIEISLHFSKWLLLMTTFSFIAMYRYVPGFLLTPEC